MIGHSVGEYVAACIAGVFSLEDALFILSMRAKLMQQQIPGSMLSVRSGENEIKEYLNEDISLAAINSPNLLVLSGETEKIKALSEKLSAKSIENKMLFTSHAYHSRLMEPALKPFISEEAKSKVELILQENNINNQIIIVHPGGGDSAPKWPASYFGEFAKHIVMNNEFNVVITGTKNELQLCDEVQALATNSFNFCSKFNLLEMIALLDKAEFVVTNSTGIIHIAAALNKKIKATIAFWGYC
jgi:hypothetical protein